MPSVFAEEWRDCLRAHYTYVVRNNDRTTEHTLRGVMVEAGFGEDELKQLYVLATAHVDDVGADFVPDMDVFAEEPAPVAVAVIVPQAMIEAELIEEAHPHDEFAEDAEDVEAEADIEDGEAEAEPPSDDDPGATQLSLF
jgi:hypothetical protein